MKIDPIIIIKKENILHPCQRCEIILDNGDHYEVTVNSFTATPERVEALWKSKSESFKKCATQ